MSDPIVSTTFGKCKGKISTNRFDGPFFSFQGIPYAKPPLGELRFKAPSPPVPWAGILDATKEGDPCIAYDLITKKMVGSENCLYLNVYTPSIDPKKGLKPTMFFIHGGAFVVGSGNSDMYGPEYLLTEDIVLVTINYRLGVLGFLNLDDQTLGVPGNAGFKDMVMALKWVKDNISNFSGDPDNVTIFGDSAGACSAHLLYLSPMSQGLFHKAILQSGCALNPWANAGNNSKDLAENLEISYKSEKDLIDKLQKVGIDELIAAQMELDDNVKYPNKMRKIGYSIEKQNNEPAFLPEDPWTLMMSGKYQKLPLMMGYQNCEGMFFDVPCAKDLFKEPADRFSNNFENYIPHGLRIGRETDLSKMVARKIKEFYANGEDFSEANAETLHKLWGDLNFARGIQSSIRNHFKVGVSPIYFYIMSVESSLNIYKNMLSTNLPGATHGDAAGYLFKTTLTPEFKRGSLEDLSISRFVKLWTNFAKNSDPNPKEKDSNIDTTWIPITEENFNYLDIGSKLSTGKNPDGESMKFWDEILKIDPSIHQNF